MRRYPDLKLNRIDASQLSFTSILGLSYTMKQQFVTMTTNIK